MRRDFIDRLPFGLGRLRHMNLTLLLCVIALMAIGVCFIYSANSIRDSVKLQSQYIGHAKTAVAGIFVVLAMAYIDYRHILRWSWLIYLVSLLLLVAVLLFGDTRMGATRWVFGFQPSELAKLALILVLAQMLGRPEARQDIWEFLLALLLAAVLVALILMQPDLGTALVFGPVLLLMLFAAGTAPRVWFGTVAAGLLAVALVVGAITLQESPGTPAGLRRAARQATFFLGDYQRDRIVDVLYPDRDPLNRGWNRRQSQIAIGSGGLWGKGFLKGDQNLLGYLPQQVSANDFIFSVLAEETGYAGALCVLLLYAGVIVSALQVAAASRDGPGRLLGTGVAALFFCHVFINIAMTIGLLPVTGLPLPFISYGRTFMLTAIVATGLLQSVAVHARRERAQVDIY
ncbi:MAG: rod shape-determining protein RodA [Lentisphaerae bacterium]|jgi:rod shape determining protein RodA|nr:rod shape-determining protein RodA [Lentisphaerota bacterium]